MAIFLTNGKEANLYSFCYKVLETGLYSGFDVMHDMTTGNYNVDHIKLIMARASLPILMELSDFGSAAAPNFLGRF